MNMQRAMISGVIALVLGLGVSDAWAQGHGRGKGQRWMAHLKSLNLSQQQTQQLKQLRSAMKTQTAPIKAQLQSKRQELRGLWLATNPNRAAIIAKHNEVDALRRQLRNARIDFRLNVFKVLTPQQRTQLQASLAARQQSGKGWGRGRGKGRWQGHGKGWGPRAGGAAF